jgi:hypothetical protein
MIRKDHIFWLKLNLSQLEDGEEVYFRESAPMQGTVHDSICIPTLGNRFQELVPSKNFRFVLQLEEPIPSKEIDRTTFVFRQFHKDYTCFRKVRADEIATLIEKEEDPI